MGNRTGASFGGKPEVSPRKKRAIARRKRIEEKAWQNKSGEVKTVYRCICDKNPEACKADVHGQKNLSIFFPFEKNIQIKVLFQLTSESFIKITLTFSLIAKGQTI